MVRLPTKEELGRPADLGPRGGIARIAVPNASGIGIGVAIADLGRGISSAAAALQQRQEQDDGIDAMRADAHAKIRRMEIERELENDPDYATWGDRYEAEAKKSDDEAAALIRNERTRERFQLQASVDTAAGKDRMLGQASDRDKTAKKVSLLDSLNKQRDIFLSPDSDDTRKAQSVADMDAYLTHAVQTGLISAEQYDAARENKVKGVVKEWAEILRLGDPDAALEEVDGIAPFRRRLEQRESGGNPAVVNKQGYAGSYQFGAPRLVDLGLYRLGKDERIDKGEWGGKKWTGTFNIPGFPDVRTIDDFLANPDAQKTAFNAH